MRNIIEAKRAVFFDRDGILNETKVTNGKPYAPRTLEEFRLKPGAIEMVERFKENDYLVVVVTNQPDVGNNLVERNVVEAMHRKLLEELPIDKIKVCYHAQTQNCNCRKPKPGMLQEAAMELGIDLSKSIMIGDRYSDVGAGASAGCFTIFLQCGYNEPKIYSPDLEVSFLSQILPRSF